MVSETVEVEHYVVLCEDALDAARELRAAVEAFLSDGLNGGKHVRLLGAIERFDEVAEMQAEAAEEL